jgi:CheY-like chemotaxis protein
MTKINSNSKNSPSKSFLFIHPDPVLSRLYQTHFSPHFTFDSAQDGLSALRKIRLTSPSVIVSEYVLPNLSGLGVLKFIRNHPELHKTPFIFLTNHPDVHLGLSHGANGWFNHQETTPTEVLEHVIKALRSQYNSSNLR